MGTGLGEVAAEEATEFRGETEDRLRGGRTRPGRRVLTRRGLTEITSRRGFI